MRIIMYIHTPQLLPCDLLRFTFHDLRNMYFMLCRLMLWAILVGQILRVSVSSTKDQGDRGSRSCRSFSFDERRGCYSLSLRIWT